MIGRNTEIDGNTQIPVAVVPDLPHPCYRRGVSAQKQTGTGNGNCGALPGAASCPDTFRRNLQERIHRHQAAGKVAQPLGEAKGSVLAAGADIAQVPFGAISGLGQVFDGPSVVGRPAKQRVCV